MYESMIDYIVGKTVGYSIMNWAFKDPDNKFIQKIKKGVKLYNKKENYYLIEYKKSNSKRILRTFRETKLRDFVIARKG